MSPAIKVALATLICVWGPFSWASYSLSSESEANELLSENQKVLEKINEYIDHRNPELRQYADEYSQVVSNPKEIGISSPQLLNKLVQENKIVLLSDIHESRRDQENAMRIMDLLGRHREEPTVVLEWIDRKYKKDLELYLSNKMSFDIFMRKLKQGGEWPFELEGYGHVLEKVKSAGFRVILPEEQAQKRSLRERDLEIVNLVKKDQVKNQSAKYLVIYGAYHILGEGHLHDLFSKEFNNQVVALTGLADEVFWGIFTEHLSVEAAQFIRLEEKVYYWFSEHPLDRNKRALEDLRKTGPSWAEASREFYNDEG